MSLRVGMVARTLNLHHIRGTGRYVQELLRNTTPSDGIDWVAYGHDPGKPLHLPTGFAGKTDVFDFRGDRFRLWEQLGLPLRAKRAGVQVLHCADNTAPVWQPMPTVVTIHDTVPWVEEMPDRLTHFYMHPVQRAAFRRCAAIITISENSRRDIEARWPEVSDRLVVIPHGIADDFFSDDCATLPADLLRRLGGAPYLIYLGGPQARKRFDWALELLKHCGGDHVHLVACGFEAGTDHRATLPADLAQRVHFAPYIGDAQLVSLYRGAVGTLYPTLYEGFGFPAVESQAAGTPVIFSPVSSLVDLVGPLSWTAPAQDFPAWLAAVREVLGLSPDARANRAQQAQAWSQRFSWRASVERHLDVYHAAADGSQP